MDHPHERGAGRRPAAAVGRRAALAAACITALPGAAAAALVLLPPPSWDAWQYALLALEFSLVFAVPAAAGLLIALTVLFRGRRRSPRERDGAPAPGPSAGRGRRLAAVAAAANAAVLAAALVPPAAIWSTARAEGARLSLAEYTAGLSTSADREPETRVYLRLDESGEEIADPSGSGAPEAAEELVLDVWEPERREDDAPLPIVVNVHGGADDLPQSLLPRWDTWLADGGRVVFDVDYRYFPDPDLVPVAPTEEWIEELRATLPELPAAQRARVKAEWDLSDTELRDLVNAGAIELVEATVVAGAPSAEARKLWLNELSRRATEQEVELGALPITPAQVARIISL
ncbi:hypothetical protein Q7689_25475, partial [Nocardiopsis tropica]|nr:hypothetical protein [Nocardiopsis tropica]